MQSDLITIKINKFQDKQKIKLITIKLNKLSDKRINTD